MFRLNKLRKKELGGLEDLVVKDSSKTILEKYNEIKEIKNLRKGLTNLLVIEILEKNVRRYVRLIEILKNDIEDNERFALKAKELVDNFSYKTREEYREFKELKTELEVFQESVKRGNHNLVNVLKMIENSMAIESKQLRTLKKKATDTGISDIDEGLANLHEMRRDSEFTQKKENLEYMFQDLENLLKRKSGKAMLEEVKEQEEGNESKINGKDVVLEKLLDGFSRMYQEVFEDLTNSKLDNINLESKNIGYVGKEVKGFYFEFGMGANDIIVMSKTGNVLFENNTFNKKYMAEINHMYLSLISTKYIRN